MATKRIETQLTIKAVDEYSGRLRNMRAVTGRFADGVRTEMSRLQDMRGPLKLIEDFRTAKAKANQYADALVQAQERLRRAKKKLSSGGQITDSMRREFEAAKRNVNKMHSLHERHRRKLGALRTDLKEAGVDTSNLKAEQNRLATALDNAAPAFRRQMDRMRRLETMQTRIADGRRRMDQSLATAGNLSFVGGAATATGQRILTPLSQVANRSGDLEEQFADFQNLTGIDDTRLVQLREELDGLRDVTKSSVSEMLSGLGVLVGKGMDFEEALAAFPAVGRAAKATKTPLDEMGASGFALYDNLKIAPGELRKGFDVLAKGGKEGGFELDAMARKLPEITAGARALGMEGVDSLTQLTAALQVSMKSAGSEDQAATNLSNFLGKLTSPETVRRFAKMGVSIEDELRKAAENGVSPFEHMLGVIDDLTGGDALKMGELFGDKQVLDFLRAMIPNLEEYRRIKEAALSADGVVDADFENAINTYNESKAQLGESVGKLFSLPPEVLESLTDLFQKTDAIVERMIVWKKENPKLVKTLFLGATALGAMAVTGGALLTAAAGLIGTLAVLRFGLVGFGARAAFAAGDLTGMGSEIGRLNRRRLRLGRPSLAGHLADFADFRRGAVGHIDAIERRHNRAMRRIRWGAFSAGAMTYLAMRNIPENPEHLAAFQENNVRSMDQFFRNAPGISHLIEGYERTFEWVHGKPPPVEPALLPNDPGVRAAANTVYQYAGEDSLPTPDRIAHLREEVAAYRAEVEAAQAALDATPKFGSGITNPLRMQAQGELDAVKAGLRRAEDRLKSTETESAQLTEALQVLNGTEVAPEINTESIDRAMEKVQQLAAGIRALPSSGAGGAPTPKPAGARAGGGPVRMGLPYLVNENTPRSEWFVPSQSGGVLNVGQAQAAFRSHLPSIAPRAVGRNPELARLHRGAQGLRAASLAMLTGSALAAPVAAQPAQAAKPGLGAVTVQIENFTVHVPSGVSDPDAIADLVSDRIGQRVAATMSASFSD
jgi:TP901 family phage tail tape measure protein